MRAVGIDEGEIQRLKIQLWDQVVPDEVSIEEPFKKPDWPEIQWPWTVRDLTLEAAEYLDSRGVLELSDWYTSASPLQSMDSRVILPYTSDGKIVGYSARWIGNVPDKKTAKMISSRPPSFVFNLDHQSQQRKYTIVTEGEYDALTLDGVAIMTNEISPEQAKIIEDIDNEPVVLPDRDRAGMTLALQAAELGWSVSFPEWPDGIKDANEAAQQFGRAATLQSVIMAIEPSPLKIKLLARRWCV
jgi:DNA primase